MNPNTRSCADPECRENPTELDDLLGHDRRGHQARRILAREDITTRAALALLSDAELLELPGFGAAMLARVRERVPRPAPIPPTSTEQFSWSGGSMS